MGWRRRTVFVKPADVDAVIASMRAAQDSV
jgi:hypothetical protein